jgi:hypothetical protein
MTSSLPQLIAELIHNCEGDDAELRDSEEIIRMVTKQLITNPGVKTRENWAWAIRSCVRQIYRDVGHKTRLPTSAIEARQSQGVLPGLEELGKWRITFADGMQIVALYATLAQLEVAASHYIKRGRENITKGRYFTALADAMRANGFRAEQTVEEFYRTQAA